MYLLSAIQFTHVMDFMVLMPLGPQLMRTFHIGPSQFSLLVTSYTFSAAVAGLICTFFLDRFDRRTAQIFCYSGFLLGTLACALAPSYEMLLLARVISGAFGGVASAIVLTIVGDTIPLSRRSHAMGIIMSSFALASVVGLPVGLYISAKISWHAPFIMILVLGVPIWCLAWKLLPSLRKHLEVTDDVSPSRKAWLAFKEILCTPNSRFALIFMFVMITGHFIIIPFISPSMVTNVKLSEQELTYFYLAGGLGSLLTAAWFGKLSDRHGRVRMYAVMILGVLAPVYLLTHQGPAPLWWVMILAFLYFSFGGGRFVPGQAMVTSAVPTRLRGGFMSLNSSVRDLAAGSASLIGGQVVVEEQVTGRLLNMEVLGWVAIGVSLISILFAMKVKAVE